MKYKLLFVAAFMLLFNGLGNAQIKTCGVIVANGGAYSNPDDFVTLNAYDPQTNLNQTKATIFTQSLQGLLVDDGYAYVAAQDSLAKVNIDNGTVEAIVALSGVNKFAVWKGYLLVSRQFPVTDNFFQIRDLSNLELVHSFTEVSNESWEIAVVSDTAYVSVAGGWNATEGKVAVIDLENKAFVREMNWGADAVGIGPVYQNNESLYFVCKTPYAGTSATVVKYDLSSTEHEVFHYAYAMGDAAGIFQDQLYVMIDGGIGTVALESMSVSNPSLITNPFTDLDLTAFAIDTINQKIYVNYSYWIAPDGVGKIYDLDGIETGVYEVGISAEDIAVDYRDFTGIEKPNLNNEQLLAYPNPTDGMLNVNINEGLYDFSVYTINGTKVFAANRYCSGIEQLNLNSLSPGTYFMMVRTVENQNSSMPPKSYCSQIIIQ